jgi:hypothetical protein
MSIWQDSLLDPIYESPIATDATLIRTTGEHHVLRAIDYTDGASVPTHAFIDMQTQRPSAFVRESEVTSFGITNLKEYFYKGEFIINGKRWRIKSFQFAREPVGPGEIMLLLADEQAP